MSFIRRQPRSRVPCARPARNTAGTAQTLNRWCLDDSSRAPHAGCPSHRGRPQCPFSGCCPRGNLRPSTGRAHLRAGAAVLAPGAPGAQTGNTDQLFAGRRPPWCLPSLSLGFFCGIGTVREMLPSKRTQTPSTAPSWPWCYRGKAATAGAETTAGESALAPKITGP